MVWSLGMPRALGAVLVLSFLVVVAPSVTAAAPTPTPSARTTELSGPGGIGNTREDVLDYWRISLDDEPAYPRSAVDHIELVIYNLPDYQNYFLFQLEEDDRQRPTDRLVSMSISLIDPIDRRLADRTVDGFLPADAKPQGRPYLNRFEETVQKYHSPSVAKAFPRIDIDGFDKPGTIWVTYFLVGDDVGVFDVALHDDRS